MKSKVRTFAALSVVAALCAVALAACTWGGSPVTAETMDKPKPPPKK